MDPLHQLDDCRPVGQAQQPAQQALVRPPLRLPHPHPGRAAVLTRCVTGGGIPARCVSTSGWTLLARSVVYIELRGKVRFGRASEQDRHLRPSLHCSLAKE